MNPVDGSPIDMKPGPIESRSFTHFLGVPFKEWMDVKILADEENVSIRELVQVYRLMRHGERYRLKADRRLSIDKQLIDAAMRPVPVEIKLERELESLRARYSLLEARAASIERRLARLRNV